MAFHRAGADALDYLPCRYGRSRLLFRGPRRDLERPYVAFLGGTETYGKFVPQPFPHLCEGATGLVSVNLGCVQAGPDVWLNDAAALDIAARAALVVLQVPGAINLTNRLYAVHPRRNDRFVRAAPLLQTLFREVDFTEFTFTRHLVSALAAASPAKFDLLAQELRQAWLARMGQLLSRIAAPKLLLWLGSAPPPDAGAPPDLSADPVLVDRAMIDSLRPQLAGYVEAVPSPAARAQGTAGMSFLPPDIDAARGLPGPAAHAEIAARLSPAIMALL
jgi:hypothetical protein